MKHTELFKCRSLLQRSSQHCCNREESAQVTRAADIRHHENQLLSQLGRVSSTMVYEEYSPNYCTDLMAKDNEEKASTLAELGHRYRLSRSPLSGKRSMMVFDSLALPSKYQVVHKSTCQLSSSATFRGTNITASDESLYFEPVSPAIVESILPWRQATSYLDTTARCR